MKKFCAVLLVLLMVLSSMPLMASATAENTVVIYYNNKNFATPYIHYSVGGGAWTAVPGEKMDPTSENDSYADGYTYTYRINIGTQTRFTFCFNDGNGHWDSKNGANYDITGIEGYAIYGVKDQVLTDLFNQKKLNVNNFRTSAPDTGLLRYSSLTLSCTNTDNGTAPYSYQFGVKKADGTKLESSYSTDTMYTYPAFTFAKGDVLTPYVNVTDSDGRTAHEELAPINVKDISIASFTASPADECYAGDMVTFHFSTKDAYYTHGLSFGKVVISKDGEEIANVATDPDFNAQWTPTEAGTYSAKLIAGEYGTDETDTQTMQYVVKNKEASNSITMYYDNASYSNAYMHYKAGNGAWTTAPGVKMASSSEQSGYTYKYTVDLGTATTFTCCFNDGNGHWDSNNGANYSAKDITGNVVYGVKNGVITKLSDNKNLGVELSLSNTTVKSLYTYITAEAAITNAVGDVYVQYTYSKDGKTTVARDFTKDNIKDSFNLPMNEGTYTVSVNVKDSAGNTATASKEVTVTGLKITEFTASPASECYTNDTVTFKFKTVDGNYTHGLSFGMIEISKDGKLIDTLPTDPHFTATWTPTEAGTYSAKLIASEYDSTNQDTQTMQYVVNEKPSEKLTVSMGVDNTTVKSSNTKITVYSDVTNASGDVYTQYTYTKDGKTTVAMDYTKDCSEYSFNLPKETGTYTVTANVKDSAGKTATISKEVKVTEIKITSFTASPADECYAGDTVTFHFSTQDACYTHGLSFGKVVISKDGEEIANVATDPYFNAQWTPTEAGTYSAKLIAGEYGTDKTDTQTMQYVVKNKETSNSITMYYDNSSYSNAYIHYKAGNGAWTTAPGVKMATSSEQSGYTYKCTLNLGTATTFTCCFNNGNGSWDSKNGANYTVSDISGSVIYGVKDGTVSKLTDSNKLSVQAVVSSATLSTGETDLRVSGIIKNAVGAEFMQITYTTNGKTTVAMDYTAGWHGDYISIPVTAGTYVVTVNVKDAAGAVATDSKTITVNNPQTSNTLTVYYTGLNNAYIHYKAGNGAWTTVPGVKMSSNTTSNGYTYAYTIDLGTADTFTCCFNDGNNHWDSNNGSNYTISGVSGSVSYGIKNSTVTKL